MNDPKKIVSKIETLKSKVRHDLTEISKHLEKLSKIMQTGQSSSAYLRCRGHMRIAGAMIRGVGNLKMTLIVPDEIEEEVVAEETSGE